MTEDIVPLFGGRPGDVLAQSGYNASSPLKPAEESIKMLIGFWGSNKMFSILGFEFRSAWVEPAIRARLSYLFAKSRMGKKLDGNDNHKLQQVLQFTDDCEAFAIRHSDLPQRTIETLFEPFKKMSFTMSQTLNNGGEEDRRWNFAKNPDSRNKNKKQDNQDKDSDDES